MFWMCVITRVYFLGFITVRWWISEAYEHGVNTNIYALKLSQVFDHQGFYSFINPDFHIRVGCTGFLANIVKLLDLSTCGHYVPSNCTHSKVQV